MKTAWKLNACWLAFVVALLGYGLLAQATHLPQIAAPDRTPMVIQFLAQLVGGAILVTGLYPLARGLTGTATLRANVVAGFLFLVLGINGVIETRAFSYLLDGKVVSAVVFYAMLSILVGAGMGLSFGAPGTAAGLAHRGWAAATGRGVVAWLAWPVIYFAFGLLVAPIVLPYYRAGVAALRIPPMSKVISIQLVRSLVFLAASLPFLALWNGSRRELWLALGLAHAVVVGIYGLAGATFLPWVLRITHSGEIAADSFVYAGLLVLLFAAPAAHAETNTANSPEAHPLPLKSGT
ncbi:MAG TPA: hypothetical protein VGS10_24505 [Terracidiphilus sp.]|nr:hypothetical protein [Terracidiphilus sp.]